MHPGSDTKECLQESGGENEWLWHRACFLQV
jgi:hypothetical protein